MRFKTTDLKGLLILEPKVFEDRRGYFFESFHKQELIDHGANYSFVQDNQSRSSYGVIRGLHYQKEPWSQTKLVRVLEGAIYDVAVDIRIGSPTYGRWFGMEISSINRLQLLIPAGFAHGFSVISEKATVFYKCDNYYQPSSESGICYNDPNLKIDWKIDMNKAIVSKKDLEWPSFKQL